MRIVFVNLHINEFYVNTLEDMIAGRHAITKHLFLLEWMLKNDIEVVNLLTLGGSSLPAKALQNVTRSMCLRKWECRYVLWKNHIPSKKLLTITDASEIREDDIVIYYGTFFPSQFETIQQVKGVKIVDHIHFYGDRESAERIRDKGISYYTYEVELEKYSKLYQRNYTWFKGGFIMKPFAFQPRFRNKRSFRERKNKAVAMGTLTKCERKDFVEAYGTVYYQPHRKMILDYKKELEGVIDSYISEYVEKPLKKVQESDLKLMKVYKKIANFFSVGKQNNYFSFNMVDKYNEYKMFICPEDINGSYGIGIVEGMACGCAMIGWNYGAFEDMGMVGGIHYIPYNGTVDDLKKQIMYYQMPEHQHELEKIAEEGCRFVRSNFTQEKVAENYYKRLKALVC